MISSFSGFVLQYRYRSETGEAPPGPLADANGVVCLCVASPRVPVGAVNKSVLRHGSWTLTFCRIHTSIPEILAREIGTRSS